MLGGLVGLGFTRFVGLGDIIPKSHIFYCIKLPIMVANFPENRFLRRNGGIMGIFTKNTSQLGLYVTCD